MTSLAALEARVEQLVDQNRRLSDRLLEAEAAQGEWIRLSVAQRQLAAVSAGPAALAALEDVVSAMLGCECFQVVALAAGGQQAVLRAVGIEPTLGPEASAFIGDTVRRGTMEIRDPREASEGSPRRPIGCVPLFQAGRITGVLVLYALLPQKFAWDATDQALLETVGLFGGKAIDSAVPA